MDDNFEPFNNNEEPENDFPVNDPVPSVEDDNTTEDQLYHFTSESITQDEPAAFDETAAPADDIQIGIGAEETDQAEDARETEPQLNHEPRNEQPQQSAYQPQYTNYRTPQGRQAGPDRYAQPQQDQRPPVQPYDFRRPYSQQPQYAPQPKRSGGGKIAIIVILAFAVVAALAIAVTGLLKNNTAPQGQLTQSEATTEANGQSETEATTSPINYAQYSSGEELSAVDIAEKCRSSVVGVMTYKEGQLDGEGSGVVMGVDSTNTYTYIMTCAHVISDSKVTYGILALDGTSYTAELVGYDSKTDIGVLKVEGTGFSVAEFGDSTQLRIGETVYAIGNPGGSEYFGSMTEGIVSAIDRNVSGTYNITCIQHDAAINPGNSGGALVNSSGQVVGINSSKIAATDYEGMGFAVPVATAKSIAESLINYGYVPNRPKLGITYSAVSNYQVYSMVVAIKGLPSGSLIITGISDDSALASTDAEVGDMIIAVNGKKMNTSDVLLDLVDKGAVGDTLTLTLCRVNSRTYQTSTFDVTIKLVEDKGAKETTTEEESGIYNFDSDGGSGGFNGDFGDFFRQYFGF